MYYIILIYILFSFLSTLYSRKDKIVSGVDYIVILSASLDSVTLNRIRKGICISRNNPNSTVIFCGKEKSKLFKEHAGEIKNQIYIQDKSTNTYEDARYCKDVIKKKSSVVLVTSYSHQIRAFHTFKRVFKDLEVYNSPTNDFFTWYSPFLPIGWIAFLINCFKDWKYNRK